MEFITKGSLLDCLRAMRKMADPPKVGDVVTWKLVGYSGYGPDPDIFTMHITRTEA
jgi:hypothetical protein